MRTIIIMSTIAKGNVVNFQDLHFLRVIGCYAIY